MMKRKMKKIASFFMALALVTGLLMLPVENVAAESANQQIQNAKNAVVQIMVCVQNPMSEWQNLVGGTGFLVGTEANSQYVITNDHVANATSAKWLTEKVAQGMVDISQQEINTAEDYAKIKTKVRVVLKRDSYIDATIVQNSAEADLAILKLDSPIYNRTPVVLDPENEPQSTEKVYALGFPGIVQAYQDDQIYTSDDVTVTDGSVSKVAVSSAVTGSPISYINHSAAISEGNSGGPLLNEDGAVIGVNDWGTGTEQTSYYYSIQIKEVTDLLDGMGIDYMKAGQNLETDTPDDNTISSSSEETEVSEESTSASSVVVPEVEDNSELMDSLKEDLSKAKEIDTTGYTEDSVNTFDQAVAEADGVTKMGEIATTDEIQSAIDSLKKAEDGLIKKSGPNMGIIIAIVAVGIIAILVVVIFVVVNRKKKKEEEARKMENNRQKAKDLSQNGFQESSGFTPRDTSSYRTDDGSTPTGVLDDGGSATTVLGNSSVPSAMLIRKKTGEKVTINKDTFRIGKERRKVDYCISDNSNISRSHADIIYKNGSFYIVDNNATNGTSVNGVKVGAGQERALTGNETIRLADEDFLFRC